jgi:hypothetical protein
MSDTRTELLVDRHAIGTTQLRTVPLAPLAPDAVRIDVKFVALTANTITYAAFGDMLGYWDFHPVAADVAAAEPGRWGNVPAMGWGRVSESNVDGVPVGLRVYGWWPLADTVDIVATPTADGFRDDGPHRAAHAPTYRGFMSTQADPMYTGSADEHRHALLRGLFVTGFLVDAFFDSNDQFGAEQAIVLSASSKTAIGYADCAHRRGAVRVVGVTSAGNVAMVRSLGVYDDVVTYDSLDSIAIVPSVLIDIAGAGAAVAAVHERLGDSLAYSMIVGKSHVTDPGAAITAGPTPQMFFAPGEIQTRLADWGPDGYRERIGASLGAFIAGSQSWLTVEEHHGPEQMQAAWANVLAGDVPPSVGVIASCRGRS